MHVHHNYFIISAGSKSEHSACNIIAFSYTCLCTSIQVVRMNDYQKTRFASKMVESMFKSVSGKRIAIFGLAFKNNTGDCRESAAAYVVKALVAERAELHCFDPKVTREAFLYELEYTNGMTPANTPMLNDLFKVDGDPYEAAAGADAIAILTEWDMFKHLDWRRLHAGMRSPAFLFDGRNILDHASLRAIGFEVYAVGKPLRGDFSSAPSPRY